MKVTQEKVTASKTKSTQLESITTNLAEFNLAEAVFLHKGTPPLSRPVRPIRHRLSAGRSGDRADGRKRGRQGEPPVQADQQHLDGDKPARRHDQQAAVGPEEVRGGERGLLAVRQDRRERQSVRRRVHRETRDPG